MTWLLVEDDTDIRNVVSMMISFWGEGPMPFPDGNAAWNWLDSVSSGTFRGELPDLALLDIRMPGHTGDKVAARIRQTSPIKDIPIILMTAFALTDDEVRTMIDETGVDLLLNKPLPNMDEFRMTLYRVRDERRARSAQRQAGTPGDPTVPAASPSQPTTTPPSPAAPTGTTAAPPAQPTPPVPTPAAPGDTALNRVPPPDKERLS